MASIYKLTSIGSAHRGGVNGAVDANVRGVAKTNEMSEFTIANELICARIGQTLGLPVPSGVVAQDDAKKLYYISLDVSFEGKQLPPVMPAEFAKTEQWLAAGIVVFDILIANGDRNLRNLSRDPAFPIPRVAVFDHGHALLGTGPGKGEARLDACRDHLGCVIDAAAVAVNDCALLKQRLDGGMILDWIGRVEELPDYVFEDVCSEVAAMPNLNFWNKTSELVVSWLKERRGKLSQLIWDNQAAFPDVEWPLWSPEGPTK